MGRLQAMQHTGPRLARLGTWLLRLLLMAAEEGEQDRGRASGMGSDADYPGPFVGRDSDHRDMVEFGPGPGDALSVRAPARSPGYFHEPYGQAEGYSVSGQL